MTDNQKPAPCPWCGSTASITIRGGIGRHRVWIMCDVCDACGPSEDATGEAGHGLAAADRAIAAWNRIAQRPAPAADTDLDALNELIAAAEECADELLYLTESDAARVPIDYTRDTSIVRRLRAAVARVRGE